MAVTTSRMLRLTFTTAGGKTFAVTIPNPKVDLQQAEAVAAIDSIIASDLVLNSCYAKKNSLKAIETLRIVLRILIIHSRLPYKEHLTLFEHD